MIQRIFYPGNEGKGGSIQYGLVMRNHRNGGVEVEWSLSPGDVEQRWKLHIKNQDEGFCVHTRITDDEEAYAYLLAQRLEGE